MTRLRVVFAYRPKRRAHGARIMRVAQLAAMAQAHLADIATFETRELFRAGQPRRQRQMLRYLDDAVVVFLKGSGGCFDEDGREALRGRARAICIDHVDGVFGAGPIFPIADLHIVSSLRGQRYAERARSRGMFGGEVAHLSHHADPRIVWRDRAADENLRPIYSGQPFNTVIPEPLRDRFAAEDFTYREEFAADATRMAGANLHWAARAPGWRGSPPVSAFKPFTKGFNAAAAGANVVVDCGEDDAVALLGDDYPYLAANASPEALNAAFEKAEATVGGPEWRLGLERMSALRARTRPEAIMAEFRAILKRFD